MKKMIIFEPAMCCETGVCGPSVDPELLRITTVVNNLKKNNISIERYNLSSNPQAFVDNHEINKILNRDGVEALPVTILNGVVVKTKAYPTDAELCKYLEVPEKYIKAAVVKVKKSCGCSGGCCN